MNIDGQQTHKRCSISLITREMQMKTMRNHCIWVRKAIIKKKKIYKQKIQKRMRREDPLTLLVKM